MRTKSRYATATWWGGGVAAAVLALVLLTAAAVPDEPDASAMVDRVAEVERRLERVVTLVLRSQERLDSRLDELETELGRLRTLLEAGSDPGVSFIVAPPESGRQPPGASSLLGPSTLYQAVASVPGAEIHVVGGVTTVRLPMTDEGLETMRSADFKATLQDAADRDELSMTVDVPAQRGEAALREMALQPRLQRAEGVLGVRHAAGGTRIELDGVADVEAAMEELIRLATPD